MVQFITNDNIKICSLAVKTVIFSRSRFILSLFYRTNKKAYCESLILQQEILLRQQDKELHHRQHVGYHSNSLHMNA
jgi:hypothetical protein